MFTNDMFAALSIMVTLKAFARKDAFERAGLGDDYGPNNATVKALQTAGLVKIASNGAVSCDRIKADRILQMAECPERYRPFRFVAGRGFSI